MKIKVETTIVLTDDQIAMIRYVKQPDETVRDYVKSMGASYAHGCLDGLENDYNSYKDDEDYEKNR